ncbi:MAG: urease accessory protein UreD [Xanthobacteraceae bacterium]
MSTAAADTARTFAANRAIGRIALAVRAKAGVTRRARVREEGSLRVRFPGAASAELEAVIVNTAGGVAGGDRFALDVTVEPGARLVVTTAAAEKVYRTLDPDATIDVTLTLGAMSSLAWLPQETILFNRARLRRTINIDLAEDARLLLVEAIVFGRAGMGEAVDDAGVFDRWRLHRGGRLIHAEAMRLDGAVAAKLAQPAVADGGVAMATVLIVPADEAVAVGVRALAGRFRGEVGVSAWNGFAVVRLCAADGAVLRHDLVAVLTAVYEGSLPRLWLN